MKLKMIFLLQLIGESWQTESTDTKYTLTRLRKIISQQTWTECSKIQVYLNALSEEDIGRTVKYRKELAIWGATEGIYKDNYLDESIIGRENICELIETFLSKNIKKTSLDRSIIDVIKAFQNKNFEKFINSGENQKKLWDFKNEELKKRFQENSDIYCKKCIYDDSKSFEDLYSGIQEFSSKNKSNGIPDEENTLESHAMRSIGN